MITINIPWERAGRVLEEAGYSTHPKSAVAMGYIRELLEEGRDKRWHAYPKRTAIEIHLDETHNGFHRVVSRYHMEGIEKRRIGEIYAKLFPETNIRSRVHDEFAPSLDDLQKMASNLNP